MSPYAEELAHARLEALSQLIDAMREAEDPAEKRRCAVAIFNAPDPCEIDDAIELEDDDDAEHTPGTSESSSESRGYSTPATPSPSSSAPSPSAPPFTTSDIAHPTSDPLPTHTGIPP